MSVVHLSFEQIGRHMIEGSGDCVKILDLDGRIVYLNPAGVLLLGLRDAQDLVGQFWLEGWEGGHLVNATAALDHARGGLRSTFEGFSRTDTATGIWWEVAMTPIRGDDDRVTHVLTVSRDVTERYRQAEFRAGQQDVLKMVATGAPLGAVLVRLAELVERQVDGMLCSVLLLDEDGVHMRHGAAPSLPPAFSRAADGASIGPRSGSCGAAMYWGRTVIAPDIQVNPSWEDFRDLAAAHGLRACWSIPVMSAQHKVLGSMAMFYAEPRGPAAGELQIIEAAAHITGIAIEHERAEDTLERTEARTRAILKAIPDWMFVLSANGVFLDCHVKNPAELVVPPEQFIGKTVWDVLPPAVADTLGQSFARALASGEPDKCEYTLESDHPQTFFESCVVRYDDDKLLAIVRNITDRKRAEMDAAMQRRELAHLGRVALLGELSGAIAHELSQPLSAILINAQTARLLLASSPVEDLDELRATVDDIIANDRRAGAVMERLRALLKKEDSRLEPLDMNDLAREVLELTWSELLARRVSVTTQLTGSIPPVHGDRVQLQQVLLNLVINACEAMSDIDHDRRRLLVSTSVDDGFVEMSVTDWGVGIPEERLDEVFQPFVTFREKGLGLGLAISRSIVHAHGGRIFAENNAERGSTFRCFLPVTRS